MKYEIQLKPKALKDAKKIPKSDLIRIFDRIEGLKNNLAGDVKRLTDHTPEYRLRSGNYRVLFEVEKAAVIIYRICHRKDVYK